MRQLLAHHQAHHVILRFQGILEIPENPENPEIPEILALVSLGNQRFHHVILVVLYYQKSPGSEKFAVHNHPYMGAVANNSS
ncbi:hypothetical protein WMZ97_08540 [Lentibacillus sp. N15]|uniref:hypothetical protein n=1 Tax=Lentibacillus songyuanensis TaxID=3136161 RepID=UPI0031BB9887